MGEVCEHLVEVVCGAAGQGQGVFEGDMVLSREQELVLERAAITEDGLAMDREPLDSAIVGRNYRWPNNTIPFEFSAEVPAHVAAKVRRVLAVLQAKLDSCLVFEETSMPATRVVVVAPEEPFCDSLVGHQGKGTQALHLGPGCIGAATIHHEFLHAAGVYHQQSRSDRDKYVQIVWENIKTGQGHNFKKYNTWEANNFGVPYDSSSVMHYPAYAFGKAFGKTTIKSLDGRKVGGCVGVDCLTPGDVLLVKRMYKCI